jgi:hypothetical protein
MRGHLWTEERNWEHCSEEDANARSDEFQKFGNDGRSTTRTSSTRCARKPRPHTIEEGHWSAAMCHLSNIAIAQAGLWCSTVPGEIRNDKEPIVY